MLALSKMRNRNKLSNSRSDTGSDGKRLCISNYAIHVSIHAPVRGATASGRDAGTWVLRFNSRSRAGSDEI